MRKEEGKTPHTSERLNHTAPAGSYSGEAVCTNISVSQKLHGLMTRALNIAGWWEICLQAEKAILRKENMSALHSHRSTVLESNMPYPK